MEKLTMSNMKNGKPYVIKRTFDVELKINEIVHWINKFEQAAREAMK